MNTSLRRCNVRPAKGRNRSDTRLGYFALMNEAEKPIGRRKERPIGRHGHNRKVRRFHIPQSEIEHYKQAHRNGDPFPNPHRSGCYHYIIEALKDLGLDQRHGWAVFHEKVKRLMSDPATRDANGRTLWDRFRHKPSRSVNAPTEQQRLLQNVAVLQRLGRMSPYGLRINLIAQQILRLRGACIDIEEWDQKLFVRLNLRPETIELPIAGGGVVTLPVPINQTKRRRGAAAGVAGRAGAVPQAR